MRKLEILIFHVLAVSLLSVFFACSGSGGGSGAVPPQTENGKNTIIAADGGVVTYNNDEVKLTIPENSLSQDAEISITPVSDLPSGDGDGLQPFGQAYKFTPAGTTFDLSTPAVMEIEYDESLLASKGFSPETLALYYYDEELKEYIAVACYVDTSKKKLIAHVEHFTLYIPMAKAKLSTNNIPYIGNQNPVPNPIRAGAPIYIRSTVRDYDGSLAGVRIYYRKLQPTPGVWQSAVMTREVRPGSVDTYGYIIPATFITGTDLGTGNDFEYYVKATDNLGGVRTSTTRRFDITRTYNSGTLYLTPSTLTIAAGFETYFVARGKDNSNTAFQLIPESFSILLGKGTLMDHKTSGILFHANTLTTAGSPEVLSVYAGGESTTANISIYSGEIKSIEILDTNGNKIFGELVIYRSTGYAFDAVGYDEFGNTVNIYPSWSADATLGAINSDGVLTVTTGNGSGKVYVALGEYTDEKTILVKFDNSFALNFSDVDESSNEIGGAIVINKAENESDITGYKLYWGSDDKTKLSGYSEIARLAKTGSDLIYNLPLGTVPPSGASHLLCYVELGGVESGFMVSKAITDVISTSAPVAGSIGSINTNGKTISTISISWAQAGDNITPANLLEYSVYYSKNSAIDTFQNAQMNGSQALNWTSNITSHIITGLENNTNYYINVFVRDSANNISGYNITSAKTSAPVTLGWGNTQYPATYNGVSGSSCTFYGQIYAEGVTNVQDQGAGIIVQFGIGPRDTLCVNNSQWNWFLASFFRSIGNNDEYSYTLFLPAAGNYDYAFRYSGDGGLTWLYGDTDGSSAGESPTIIKQGKLTVN